MYSNSTKLQSGNKDSSAPHLYASSGGRRGGDVNGDLFASINKNRQTDAQMMICFSVD